MLSSLIVRKTQSQSGVAFDKAAMTPEDREGSGLRQVLVKASDGRLKQDHVSSFNEVIVFPFNQRVPLVKVHLQAWKNER